MSVIENIKNFFADDRTSTMNTGEERFSLLRAPVADRLGYDDFSYPYSPMQRSKRYPKIINAYALESRANGDLAIMRNHRDLIAALTARIEELERYIFTGHIVVRTMATRANNFSAGDSSTLQQEFTIASNEEIVGVRAVYVIYGNTLVPATGFRVNTFGFTVTENAANKNKDVLLKVAITNQSGQYYGNVYAVVEFGVYVK